MLTGNSKITIEIQKYPKCVIMKIPWERIKDMITIDRRKNKMNYIYCYTNKINQHKYVGQTNNLNRRVREHRSCVFNKKTSLETVRRINISESFKEDALTYPLRNL